jgi:tetratricopeptide (TPR) repeat protein
LHNETKLVLGQPPAVTWDEQAAWTSLKAQLQKLDLDSASYAMWLTNTCRSFASRNITDPSASWLNEAVELLRQLVSANPNSPLMHRRLSLALAVQGRVDESAKERQIAVDQEREDPNYFVSLANLLRQADQFDEAVSVLERGLRTDAKHFPSLISLGSLQRQLGKLKESRETLRRGLAFDPNNAALRSELRRTERALGMQPREVATEQ